MALDVSPIRGPPCMRRYLGIHVCIGLYTLVHSLMNDTHYYIHGHFRGPILGAQYAIRLQGILTFQTYTSIIFTFCRLVPVLVYICNTGVTNVLLWYIYEFFKDCLCINENGFRLKAKGCRIVNFTTSLIAIEGLPRMHSQIFLPKV